jgi:hypothetical protein
MLVSRPSFGGLFVSSYGAEFEEGRRAVLRGLELGVNYFDTAPTYANSEEVRGKSLEGFLRRGHAAQPNSGCFRSPRLARSRETGYHVRRIERSRRAPARQAEFSGRPGRNGPRGMGKVPALRRQTFTRRSGRQIAILRVGIGLRPSIRSVRHAI